MMTLVRRSLLLGAAAALIAACGGGGDAPRSADGGDDPNVKTFAGGPAGGTLIVLAEGDPDDLNPLTWDSNMSYQLVHLMFRALARRDSTLTNYTPDLLARWEQPDATTVLLHLRPDVKWHDGEKVKAQDVVFTIESMKSEAVASPRQGDVSAVASARAVDSLTVEVKLTRGGPAALNALLEVVPAPSHLLGRVRPDSMRFSGFGRRPVGNGLFRFARWDRNQQVVLEANRDAPDGRPSLDRIIVRTMPDATARLTALMNGEGDLLPRVAADQTSRLRSAQNVRLMHAARIRPGWIAWNVDRPPVNDPRVRRALMMAIDRTQAVHAVLGPEAEPALTPIPPRLRQHPQQIRTIPFDLAGAARLLDSAGIRDTNNDGVREFRGRPLVLEVEYSNADPVRQDLLIRMQSDLSKVGVQLTPKPYERTTWVERLRGREFTGSFWGWGWGPGVLAPNAEAVFHSRSIPPKGPNFAGYRSPRVDALIDSLLVATDDATAQPLWAALEQQLTDDAVYAPIFLDPEFYGVNTRFENVKLRGPEWWEDVIYWHVPTDRRTARDRMTAR
jgi:peptide/nickel transport system substrate-binding protein